MVADYDGVKKYNFGLESELTPTMTGSGCQGAPVYVYMGIR